MAIDKPQISILMAVYDPNLEWFREQLVSLNAQTYPNIKLYIRDDCSPKVPYDTVQEYVRKYITAFPYEIARNEENLGSNDTFECLTREADGEYFAYCDQDDVWLPEKLTVLQDLMKDERVTLACSDMFIIDGQGNRTGESIRDVRRHHVFHEGEGLAAGLIFHTFVTGCTTLIRASVAKEAVPFCPHMIHDQHLAVVCADKGAFAVAKENLINYRIHGGNQTSLMMGVEDKDSYYRLRIKYYLDRVEWLREHLTWSAETHSEIEKATAWMQAREKNWRHKGGKATIWKYRYFNRFESLYEIFANWAPSLVLRGLIHAARRNWI